MENKFIVNENGEKQHNYFDYQSWFALQYVTEY